MKVVLDAALFGHNPSSILLSALAHHALLDDHRLILSDETDVRFIGWLNGLPTQEQEEWRYILDVSLLLEAREPCLRSIILTGATNWTATPPEGTLEEVLRLLRRPFRVLVENSINDRNFVLSMANEEQRREILRHEEKGNLVFQHAGGITSMKTTIDRQGAGHPSERLTVWVLFDGDALCPGRPSGQSQRVIVACERKGIPYYQLRRRAIENYIPLSVLQSWAYNRKAGRRERHAKYQALCELRAEQRNHYNMKSGFKGDAARVDEGQVALYAGVPDSTVRALEVGFGEAIATLLDPETVVEEELRRDGAWVEVNPQITRLLALMR